MAGLVNIPWNKIRMFSLRWDNNVGEIVPIINIMMYDNNYDKTESEETAEIDIDLLIPTIDKDTFLVFFCTKGLPLLTILFMCWWLTDKN